jgi:hypothetical protein
MLFLIFIDISQLQDKELGKQREKGRRVSILYVRRKDPQHEILLDPLENQREAPMRAIRKLLGPSVLSKAGDREDHEAQSVAKIACPFHTK